MVSGRNSPSELLSGADVEDAGLLSGRRKKFSSWYAPSTSLLPFVFDFNVTTMFSSHLAHLYRSIPEFYALRSTVPRSSSRSS